MRIDKFLSNKGFGSRKEVHQLLKQGVVQCNGQVIKAKDLHIDETVDVITVNGSAVSNKMVYYIKFHKPAGYITAMADAVEPTIMELLPPEFTSLGVAPVGRLDKDTEGLILLSNDGQWAHRLIHGQKEVNKTYYVTFTGELTEEGKKRIQEGMILGDGTILKPAVLEELTAGSTLLTIQEGKYHQVKRMIAAAGGTVTYLKRLQVGPYTLEGIEEPGQWSEIE